MKLIRGREFLMGSNDHYPEEAPVRRVTVEDFWIDEHPVTNAEFAKFIADTGYATLAEIAPNPADYPGMPREMARAGSFVFTPTTGPGSLDNPTLWWRFAFGASWLHPLGPETSIAGIMDHPVVHVAWPDAVAYANWAGKALPTEAEWEFAARGGLEGAVFGWGNRLVPDRIMANYWHGAFPWENTAEDGYQRTSPVGAFPPNGYGLYDTIGNVWEWTQDWFTDADAESGTGKCSCGRPQAGIGARSESYDPRSRLRIPRKVMKGGSHLCAENYCQRYRPAARYAQPIDSPASHTGFRCVIRCS
jgi:sulfatase modifying factor 1